MALYFYQALSKGGKRVSGYIDASTIQAVKDQLTKTGNFPVKIELADQRATKVPFYKRFFQRSISLKEKIFFTKQLTVLLKSGIPLLQALDLLVEQTEGKLKNIVISLRDGIKEGRSLADELQKYPKAFDSIYIQLVRAGEATGKLEVILERLNTFLTKREEIKKKISGALRYPLIQLGVIGLVVVALLYFVVPAIAGVFKQMDMNLPLATRILLAISNFFIEHFIFIIIFVILLVTAYQAFKATPKGAYFIDKIKLKLPIIGYFTRVGAIVQFSRTFGMLLEGGVNLAEALNIVVKIIDNKVLTDALQKAQENIIKQGKVAQYLKETKIFPPVAIYLISTGEQSGELDTMLLSVAQYFEDDLEETADSLTALLNPIMLLLMAGIVGFVILAILGPIQQMTQMVEDI